ncbi:hypothetical protein DL93DRAFT_153121 [Clavulina sp. PMI_390]|nr:hypothetical protein DL93DRAFT_153121 [Clavulina sp. PMI_390]
MIEANQRIVCQTSIVIHIRMGASALSRKSIFVATATYVTSNQCLTVPFRHVLRMMCISRRWVISPVASALSGLSANRPCERIAPRSNFLVVNLYMCMPVSLSQLLYPTPRIMHRAMFSAVISLLVCFTLAAPR